METVWKQLSSELFPLFPEGSAKNAASGGKKILKKFKMETVWKRFWVQLRKVSTRSALRALLGEKCGFVGCEKIENLEMETVETVWKRFWKQLGNGFHRA